MKKIILLSLLVLNFVSYSQSPTANPVASPSILCEGDVLTLTANPSGGTAPYTFAWTGPNGFTSGDENPTIVTVPENSGVYTVIVTDALNFPSTPQNTGSVVVNEKVDPFFEGLNPGLCKDGTPPILPNQSTNGIFGTWNPAVVDNSTAGIFQYTFTPDAGQCANNFIQTIFVVNNVNPTFSFPTSICVGSTAPTLPSVSNNGILGTWNPSTVNNTTTGTYTFTPSGGQCALVRTITVTVNPQVTPSFTLPSFVCQNGNVPLLPLTSNNGISGTWNPTTVNNTMLGNQSYTFTPNNPSQCGLPTTINISVNPNITPTFNPIAPICENATAPILPLISTNGITGTWNPSSVDTTQTGSYTFTPNEGQCATTASVEVIVNPLITPTFDPFPTVCFQSTVPLLPSTSLEGITGTWNPATISNTVSGTYTFTPNDPSQCGVTVSINITVEIITPTFDTIAPICENATAPILTTTSNEGITGTWNPSIVDNTNSGTYTFTPDANQCATTTTISITVIPNETPLFDAIDPICENDDAPLLQTTSINGFTGTWNPATVDVTQTGTYTFTPDDGQCATTTTLTVIVNPNITPGFSIPTTICENQTAPILPTTSNNGITGTWNPSIVNNTQSGSYTFTPDFGQCAIETIINITVEPNVTPVFDDFPIICVGETAPILPTTANNGITGTWNPSIVSNTQTGIYTFTPNANECAVEISITITVGPNITPTFEPIPEICYETEVPSLPLISLEGITGTWNPATISNIASGTYTFTPNDGQCALSTSINVSVLIINPTFAPIPPICYGDVAPVLATTSLEGITGTWNPSTVSNTQSGNYTFTPDANQCATETTISISVNTILPIFNPIAPICFQSSTIPVLPSTSNNGITGSWNPSVIDNATAGTYLFTPNGGQCATEVSINTTILIITPEFTLPSSICENAIVPVLPLTSNNGITGTWNPATVSNTQSGNYVFTPDANQCATALTFEILVNPNVTPTFNQIADVCFQTTTVPVLPTISNEGISGTWNPSVVSNTTPQTYTFTPDNGICALQTTMFIGIQTINPTFVQIEDVCFNTTEVPSLPLTSNEGITGTWNPSIISSTTPQTYTFTPNANQCATTTTMTIGIQTINPTFVQIEDVCFNTSVVPLLPLTSNEGITGTWNPSIISSTTPQTYTFTPDENQCATIATMTIGINTINPTFVQIEDVCFNTSVVPSLPLTSNEGITGTWNPAVISSTTSQTYTFTPDANQCATTVTMTIGINTINPTFDNLAPICENATAPILSLTSLEGITGTWNPAIVDNTQSGSYTFTPNEEQCASTTTINFIVIPNVTPTFNPIPDVCYNTTAPSLPLVSNEGITGTWNPATIDNTQSGTYIFTPNPSECAVETSIVVNVTIVNPTFSTIPPICQNATAPILPTVSNEGITGTWNPAVVDTNQNGSYTFTPDANQCATNGLLEIIIIPNITPTFNQIADVCYLTSNLPVLPNVSNEGITGTWNPAVVSNSVAQTYTFTPNNGECAFITTMNIGINTVTTTFNQIADVCYLTSNIPVLPTVSNEGITGTWNPSIISNEIAQTYTFTPNLEQCATIAIMTIGINSVTPTFNAIPNVCFGSSTIPSLPFTSIEGITGTWNPAMVSNTQSGTYVFTPNLEQCATTGSVSIIVDVVNPTFNFVTTLCENATAPVLPLTSIEGITGTWNPAIIDNTQTGAYTFTPNPEQCAAISNITVTVGNNILPTFNFTTTYCDGATVDVLPLTSVEGITGTWNATTISNTQSGTYIFTPDAGQCALMNSVNVTIVPNVTPSFTQIAPFCSGTESMLLPTTSIEGFTGTWNPSIVDTTQSETYTFTPNAGQCATIATMIITVYQSPTDLDFQTTNVFNQTANGIIEITNVTNGVSPYSYSINGSNFTSETTYNQLTAGDYEIVVQDANGCQYTEIVTIESDCMFPKGISPNGDGKNDTFNLSDCFVGDLDIFNRYGTKVNSYKNYSNQWDGTSNAGQELPDGTYYYVAKLTDGTSKTGWVYINREQ